MLFNSLAFLVFFPIVTISYFFLPHRWRWVLLLSASCLFYMFFIPKYILILLITILIDFTAGILIENSHGRTRKYWLLLSIVSTCGVLGTFKYYDFFIDNINDIAQFLHWNYSMQALHIILPIGLSFHTFQSLSYVIEVYRGRQKAETHFGIYSLYVMYYPQLVAGPIERPQNLLHQFKSKKYFRFQNFYSGLRLMLTGFFMKLVVADRLSIYVDAIYSNYDKHTGQTLALATTFFSFQIYCDFAGYSSIALGTSRMMGIRLMTNFVRPYLSKSVSDFWRRWHISLSTWFKDYVYIPMGGNRGKSKWRRSANLLITFLISGFWHGANWTFIVWGALNGCYLMLENLFKSLLSKFNFLRLASGVFVFLLITISWIFFRAPSISVATLIMKKICTLSGPVFIPANPELLAYCFLAVLLVFILDFGYERLYKTRRLRISKVPISAIYLYFIFFLIVTMGVFDGGQFIYFQF